MSYILDALRRADAERERGRVPGLHSQTAPMRSAVPRPPRGARRSRGPLLLGLGALAAAIAGIAWWMTRDDAAASGAPPVAVAQAPATPPAPPALQPEPPPAPPPRADAPSAAPAAPGRPAPTTPAPHMAQTPAAPVEPILAPPPPPAPPPIPSTPAPAASAAPAPPAAARAPAPTGAPAATTPRPAPGAANNAAGGEANLPRVNDLNPTARAGLPPLKVSGTTYAANPALRMLILDGQVVQEGQDIAPGLKLESIGPRAAVIVHQGQRLRLTY